MIERLALWTTSECESYAERVLERQADWISRHPELPSYTLGAAAYLDVPEIGVMAYALRARRLNALLEASFPSAYGRLTEVLGDHFRSPVILSRRFALPGFHLFLHHPRLVTLSPSLHFDLQYRSLRWPEAEAASPEDRCSFTVLVRGPASGAGLKIWPLRNHELGDDVVPAMHAFAQQHAPERHRYTIGELFLHDGDHLHQIDESYAHVDGESRITLQGHGQKTKDGWVLYW